MEDLSRILIEVYDIILDRKHHPKPNSYTSRLLSQGLNAIVKKLGEEFAELISAAQGNSREELIHEVTDVVFHILVLLAYKDIHVNEIFKEFEKRRKSK